MKIHGLSTSQISPLSSLSSTSRTAAPAGSSTSGALSLSPTGSLMLSAQQAVRSLPAVREAPVREFSRQLNTGRYHSSPEAIASAMVDGSEGVRTGE